MAINGRNATFINNSSHVLKDSLSLKVARNTNDICPEVTKKWGVSEHWLQKFCEENRIPSVARFSRMWLIPKDEEKLADGG